MTTERERSRKDPFAEGTPVLQVFRVETVPKMYIFLRSSQYAQFEWCQTLLRRVLLPIKDEEKTNIPGGFYMLSSSETQPAKVVFSLYQYK